MIRVGVFGTCQAAGFAASVRALLPDADVSHFFLGSCTAEEVHSFAAGCDLFMTQPILAPEWGELCTARLPQARLAVLPHVVFTGFHPDLTHVVAWAGANSAFHGYHSALVAACFCLGLPAERVPTLFNRYVYDELGYFAEYQRARDFLVRSCAELGFDISGRLDEWAREASFMHTINHPGIRVLFDVVAMSLARAGLIAGAATTALPADGLEGLRWPVFDCVAERLEITGDPLFRAGQETMALPDFTARSYAAYAEADRDVLEGVPAIARTIAGLERIGLR